MQVSAQQPDADQVLNKSRELTLTGSLSATVTLAIKEKNGSSRNRTISMVSKSFPGGTEKRIVKFLEPADVRGIAMLFFDNKTSPNDMWIYLPALKKTRRIVSTDKGKSFMSSEFSNADMASPVQSDFTNRHVNGSGTNNQWIIESVPVNAEKGDEYGYSRKITYMSMDKYQVQKMEFYNFDNELFKIIEVKSIQQLPGGKYVIRDMLANNVLTGRKSELTFTNITENPRIDDSAFTVQNLER